MTLVLIAPGDDAVVDVYAPANRGWDRAKIMELLAEEIASGDCEVVDGTALSDYERDDIYTSAMLAKPQPQVKGVFGAGPGQPTTLGTLVPALVDYDGPAIAHIYPMSLDGRTPPRTRFWTILDYVSCGWETPDGNLTDDMCYPDIEVLAMDCGPRACAS